MALGREKRMTVVLIVLGSLVGLVVLMGLIGLVLPRGHVATVSARLAAPYERVWTVVRDFPGYADWQPGVHKVERLPDQEGLRCWRLHRRGPPLTFVVAEDSPPGLLVTRIADKRLPFGGSWVYEVKQDGDGTAVSVTERGEIYNPVFRFLARFVFGYYGALEQFVGGLAKQLGETVTLERK